MDDPRRAERSLPGVLQNLWLSWKLLRDGRVPIWTKLVPLLSVAYVIWPLDLLADPILGLGQVDDLAVVLLLMRLFVQICPSKLVKEYTTSSRGTGAMDDGQVVDVTYRVLDGDGEPDD